MNRRFFRRAAAALLAAALLGSAAMLTGCAESSGTSEGSLAYSPKVPDSKVDEAVPGDSLTCGIGETVDYQSKVKVTFDRVIELDSAASTEHRILLAEMTIVNNSTEAIDCSTLTHFSGRIDGEDFPDIQNITAGIFARKYYTATQSPLLAFNQEIAAGESVSGYVYLQVPSAWKSLEVIYKPYRYYNNDSIVLTVDETKLTHYTAQL